MSEFKQLALDQYYNSGACGSISMIATSKIVTVTFDPWLSPELSLTFTIIIFDL